MAARGGACAKRGEHMMTSRQAALARALPGTSAKPLPARSFVGFNEYAGDTVAAHAGLQEHQQRRASAASQLAGARV